MEDRKDRKQVLKVNLKMNIKIKNDCVDLFTLVDMNDAAALKNISNSAPDVPPIEAEIESASLSHSAALSAS